MLRLVLQLVDILNSQLATQFFAAENNYTANFFENIKRESMPCWMSLVLQVVKSLKS